MIEPLVQTVLGLLKLPQQDVERNVRALLAEQFAKMDVVPRQELERYVEQLRQAEVKMAVLEQQMQVLLQGQGNVK